MWFIIRNKITHIVGSELQFPCTGTEIPDNLTCQRWIDRDLKFCKICARSDELLFLQDVAMVTNIDIVQVKRAADNYKRGGRGSKALAFAMQETRRMVAAREAFRWGGEYEKENIKKNR